MIELIFWPLLAAFVLTGIHVYLGLQVVMRGVIFVDLALAQMAALGTAIGVVMGLDHDSITSYLLALGLPLSVRLYLLASGPVNGNSHRKP